MNVLSLFDGKSCGLIALERAGIKVDNYYSSEIDRYAIDVSKANYPHIIRLGDIKNWRYWDIDWYRIDLIIGGSPCQGFSFAGKQLNFDDPRSALFFVFRDIVTYVQSCNSNVKFLLENVVMKKESEAVITDQLGVEPVRINSNILSAQNRDRLYWANWEIKQPGPQHLTFGDIREYDAPECHYYSKGGLNWILKHSVRKKKPFRIWQDDQKIQMLEASMYKNYSAQRFFGVEDVHGLRYISLLEAERGQCLPEGYTDHVSNTQRYKMIGNGWEVNTITHIFNEMKRELNVQGGSNDETK